MEEIRNTGVLSRRIVNCERTRELCRGTFSKTVDANEWRGDERQA